jgi:hypothetical protein
MCNSPNPSRSVLREQREKSVLEERTEKKKEERKKAREAETLAGVVGGMRATAVDVDLRQQKLDLAALAQGVLAAVEKEEEKMEGVLVGLEKMEMSE